MRRIGAGLVALLLMMTLSGCWNRIELNELGIVAATGVDFADGEWTITYQIIVPSTMSSGNGGAAGSSSQAAIHCFSVTSKTIHQALNLSNLENPRRIYVAHNNIVVIGKNAAEHGLGELIDYYFRNTEPRETVQMAVTEGTARELLNKLTPPEKLPGASLSEMLTKESKMVSVFPIINIIKFAMKMNSDAKGLAVPVVNLVGERSEANEENLKSQDILKQTEQPLKLKITKLGIFQGTRLAGWLDYEESFGLSWITGEIHNSEIFFPCNKDNPGGERAALSVISSKTKVTPKKSSSHYIMQIKVKVKGNLRESNCHKDLSNPMEIRELQGQIEQEITGYINTGWSALKKLKTDAVGFADKIHKKFPSDWKNIKDNWQDEFNQMDLEVQVQATIRRTGLLQKSLEQSDQN